MAEEKRSIEISYKANLKDLVSKLKTLPNVTGTEAKKMVAELDRQLKQAEKAAKKAAEAQKKAAQASSKAFRGNARALSEIDSAANSASENLEGVADSAGEVDRGFMAVSLALGQVNPALGEAANMAADVAAVSEGLLLTIKNLNPIILAGAAAVGVLTLGFASYFDSVKKAREATIQMRAAQKDINQGHKELKLNLDDVTRKLQDQRLEFELSTGQISELDYNLRKAELTGKDLFKANVETQKENIKALEETLKLIRRVQSGDKAITDEEKTQLRNLQLTNSNIRDKIKLLSKGMAQQAELGKLEDNIQEELSHQNRALEGINQAREEHVDLAQQMIQNEDELASETERAAEAEKKRLETLQKEEETRAKLEKLISQDLQRFKKIQDEQKKLSTMREELDQRTALALDREIASINIRYDEEIDRIKELAQATGEQENVKAAIASLEEQRENDLHNLKVKNREEIKHIDENITNDILNDLSTISSNLEQVYSNLFMNQKNVVSERQKEMEEFEKLSQAEQERTKRQQKIMTSFFRAEQSLSIAKIAFSTAEAIMKAQAMYAPGSPAAIAASVLAGATGATQAAVVASRQPPSFHMGGMAPDEMGARVLSGEAILDRATVRRLGGEQGVKQLQQKPTGKEAVIVIQPFRHFGRFTREIGFVPPKQTGIRAY